jgi:hypothetical protein
MGAAIWSTAGLVMSLVGVILLFRFGMPHGGMRTGGGLVLTTEPRPHEAKRERRKAPKSLDEVDPEILRTYEKLGIPLREQELLAGVVRRADGREGGAASEVVRLGWLGLALIVVGTVSQIMGAWLASPQHP